MSKQRFKNQIITRRKVVNNILKIWNRASDDEKYDWYHNAHYTAKLMSQQVEGDNPVSKTCGVIAALSPRKRWGINKEIAYDLITTGDCGHMELFKQKAKDILNSSGTDEEIGSILRGEKIVSFYKNIKYPDSSDNITIDRHALSISLGKKISEEEYRGITKNQYNFFKDCYVAVAEKVGVPPILMQSATWVNWRKNPKF
ncbi:MAG: hypothetical protein KDC68_04305 [Gelidibacter sp.]|nr:hypothetical protein [Gelidibacter sp.]